MARTPRASVSKTSGQGVSRLAYQKGYRLKGGSAIKGPGKGESTAERNYSKTSKGIDAGDFNVSYGDTLFPTDLKELEEFGREKPMKASVSDKRADARKLK
jgi:hypothetical protein